MSNRHPGYGERPEDITGEECSGTTLPILLTLVELALSVLWVGAIMNASSRSVNLRIVLVVFCLLVFGSSLHTVKVTNGWCDWRYIPQSDKTIAALTLAAGLAMIAATCYVCCSFYTWAQGTSE
jgi:hypothetical protein